MFEDGEGLRSPVKFAVAATYDKFAAKWSDLSREKLAWVNLWAPLLDRFTVQEINAVADYCVREFRRPPVPVEFMELASRCRAGKPLSEPIVSKLERMAYLILASEEFATSDISLSEISDACLMAAAIAHLKSYDQLLGPRISEEFKLQELSGRATMFGQEAANWRQDALEGKGYWKDVFEAPAGGE
jgi:hypothetical protein